MSTPTSSFSLATVASVLDALPIAAWIAGNSGTPTYLSLGWERLVGPRPAGALDRYRDAIHSGDRETAVRNWAAARSEGLQYRDTMRLRFADGSFRWVIVRGDPYRGPDGSIAAWIGTVSDIDDARSTADRLASALGAVSENARLASDRALFAERLMEANEDCLKILDLDTRVLTMNENGKRVLAIRDFESVRGTVWLDFWSGDDRVAAEAAVRVAIAGGRGRFVGQYAVEHENKWWDVSITPVPDPEGRPEHLLAVSRDVTELERRRRELVRSEERFRVLSETLPGVIWSAGPDGSLETTTRGRGAIDWAPVESRLGEAWLEAVHPEDREATRTLWQRSIETGAPYDATFRMRARNETYRWQLVRALPQRDETGCVLRWFGVSLDIDEQRKADESRQQLVRLAEASDDFIGISDTDGRLTYANAAMRAALAIGDRDGAPLPGKADLFASDDRSHMERETSSALRTSGRWLGEARLQNAVTGAIVPVWYNTFVLHDEKGRATGSATIARDLRERRRMEIGMRALAETGAAMYGSLDLATTIANVTAAVSTSFATWCSIEMLDEDDSIRTISVTHRDPAIQGALQTAVAARRFTAEHPAVRAIRSGDSSLMARMPHGWHERVGAIEAIGKEGVDRIDTRSVISVPIRSGHDSRVFGSMTCAIDGGDPREAYAVEDVRFAEEIAARAALAFDHARSYERERRIAVTLQKASLPEILPTVDHLYLSADYRPGKSEATIGGDWYDAFSLEDGRVAITIGDVLGNGLGAAVTMGKVRQAMQAVAYVLPDPNTMLAAADRTVRAQSEDTYATALAGIYDPNTRRFAFASAGHPGPVLRRADGSIEGFDVPGILLGLRDSSESEVGTIQMEPGCALAFFTDGLIEANRDIEDGHRRVRAGLGDDAVCGADNPAHALVERVLEGHAATDDIAVLIAEVGPSVRFDERSRTAKKRAVELGIAAPDPVSGEIGVAATVVGGTMLTIPAVLSAISAARHAIRTLLRTSGAPLSLLDETELAAGELLANAIEHGRGDDVTIAIRARAGKTVIAVSNEGAVFELPRVILREALENERGRGLAMLGALGWAFDIACGELGRCTVTATLSRANIPSVERTLVGAE